MRVKITLLIFNLSFGCLYSQNLIVNGNFEKSIKSGKNRSDFRINSFSSDSKTILPVDGEYFGKFEGLKKYYLENTIISLNLENELERNYVYSISFYCTSNRPETIKSPPSFIAFASGKNIKPDELGLKQNIVAIADTIKTHLEWTQYTQHFIAKGQENIILITVLSCESNKEDPFIYFIDNVTLRKEKKYDEILTNSGNLVPNGGFEDFYRLPFHWSNEEDIASWNKNGNLVYWEVNSVDFYFYNPATPSMGWENFNGYQKPFGGYGYAGINIFTVKKRGTALKPANIGESLFARLNDTLEKNTNYCVKLYVALADSSRYPCNCLSIKFFDDDSLTKLVNKEYEKKHQVGPALDFIPDFKLSEDIIKNTDTWKCVANKYQAKGTEKFILIGSYLGCSAKYLDRGSEFIDDDGYYYIDDVSVVPISDSSECKCEQKTTTVQNPDTFKKDTLQKIEVGEIFILENIYFETGKSELLQSSHSELEKLSELFLKYPQLEVEISGHTDSTGNQNENLILSEGRAKAVVDFLISKGISKEKLNFKGYGSNQPIANNETEEGRQQNRRVEFKILKK